MKAFTEPLLSLAGFEEMTKTAEKSSGLISVTGCIDAQKSTDDILPLEVTGKTSLL